MSPLRLALPLLLLFSALHAHATGISGAGSSAAQPLYARLAALYSQRGQVELDYRPVGSSAGLKQLKDKLVDFGASDVALSAEQQARDKVLCFPSAISGVVPVYNLPGIRAGELQLTGALLAAIYARKITHWNDPQLAALNRGLALPPLPIVLLVRQDGSGSTYNFTDYLAKASPAWQQGYGRHFTIAWAAGATPVKGSAGVAAALRQTPGAIGYIDYHYVVQDKLAYARLQNQAGRFVAPSAAGFSAALANSGWNDKAAFEEMLTDKPGAASWPITAGTFIVVPQAAAHAERMVATLKFFTWGFIHGDQLVGAANFVRLPDRVQGRIFSALTGVTDSAGQPLKWSLSEVL